MRGIRSSAAPSIRKMGSTKASPVPARTSTRRMARSRLWVVSRRTRSQSPAPMAREMTEVAPMLMPMEVPVMKNTTGKVNPMAASSRFPSCPT
jgi:hypothetical protein